MAASRDAFDGVSVSWNSNSACDMQELLETLSYLATALGVPAALFVFTQDRRRERRRRFAEAYSSIDTAYVDFIKLCLDHPEVPILREELMSQALATEHQEIVRRKKWMLYSILLSVVERAYLTMHDSPESLYRAQWAGWESWALDYLRIPECRRVWNAIGKNLDTSFYEYMTRRLIESTEDL